MGCVVKSQRGADARTVDRLVASRRPAGALLDAGGVIGAADQEHAPGLLLKWHFKQGWRRRTVNNFALTEPWGCGRSCNLRGRPRARRHKARAAPHGTAGSFIFGQDRGSPPRWMEPLWGEWQSVQASFPSGTGWWLAGRTGRARRRGIGSRGVSVARAGATARRAP